MVARARKTIVRGRPLELLVWAGASWASWGRALCLLRDIRYPALSCLFLFVLYRTRANRWNLFDLVWSISCGPSGHPKLSCILIFIWLTCYPLWLKTRKFRAGLEFGAFVGTQFSEQLLNLLSFRLTWALFIGLWLLKELFVIHGWRINTKGVLKTCSKGFVLNLLRQGILGRWVF